MKSIVCALFVGAVVIFGGCEKSSNGPSPVATGSIKSFEQPCIQPLKNQMKRGEVGFINTPETTVDDIVDNINSDLKTQPISKTSYEIVQNARNHSVGVVIVSKEISSPWSRKSTNVRLSLVPDNDQWPLRIQSSYKERRSNGTQTFFEQTINVDKNCSLRPISSSKTDLIKTGPDTFDVNEYDHTLAGDQFPKSIHVKVPEGSEFESALLDDVDDDAKTQDILKTKRFFHYGGIKMPLLEYKVAQVDSLDHLNPLSGRVETFAGYFLQYLNGDSPFMTMTSYSSTSSPFSFVKVGAVEFLAVGESFWDQTPLTVYEDFGSRRVSINHDQYRNYRPLTFHVLTDRQLDYSNLKAYWETISEKTTTTEGFTTEYVLRGQISSSVESKKLDPDVDRYSGRPFLKETPYIQISLPQAQDLIRSLKSGFYGTRLDMAKRILVKVNETISYDDEMVSENTVGTLRTDEIFKRRKGVCQHFANLFATLARGVGIPTRIVTGYFLLENGAVRHAWNEIEVSDGVWLPIEPQRKKAEFDYSRYLPIAVSSLYDDPENKDAYNKEIQGFVMMNFKIESL